MILPAYRLCTLVQAAVALLPGFLLGSPTAAQCGLDLPAAGETVTWTAAGSPYIVCSDITLAAGSTLIVEAGVTVSLAGAADFSVEGRLEAQGTSGLPVVLTGPTSARILSPGEVVLAHTEVSCRISQSPYGAILMSDSTITVAGDIDLDTPIDGPLVLSLERTEIHTPDFDLVGQIAVRDVTFHGTRAALSGYPLIDGFTSNGGSLELLRDYQPGYVGDVAITNVAGPAITLKGTLHGGTDFSFGTNTLLLGNDYPVKLLGAGIVPGTVLETGNLNDVVLGPDTNSNYRGDYNWPDTGLPYLLTGTPDFSGRLIIHPGVTVRMAPSSSLGLRADFFKEGQTIRGVPGAPIHFEPDAPGQEWYSLAGIGGTFLFEHLVVEGAGVGIASPQATLYVNESEIRNCSIGMQPSGLGTLVARGTRFLDNGIGAITDSSIVSAGGLDLDGTARSNVFAGNAMAIDHVTQNSSVVDARGNWWNDASGPFASSNPGGLGDPVDFNVDYSGFLTSAPDLSDVPPVVRFDDLFFLVETGERVHLQWQANDDVGIVEQTLLFDASGGGNFDFRPVGALAPGARSFEWTVPDVGYSFFSRPMLLRLEVVDTAGNRSFDQVSVHLPRNPPAGDVSFTTPLDSFIAYERVDVCWRAFSTSTGLLRTYLLLESDERIVNGPTGFAGVSCGSSPLILPRVSTDRARLALVADANGNVDEWYFSEPFSIRLDPRLGDAPPNVQMLTPAGGELFPGGTRVPITWTASDDEVLRSFKIQASTNGGHTWRTIARDLPGTARSFDWAIPASAGITDVRVRVVAIDLRFQNSADGDDHSFSIVPAPVRTGTKLPRVFANPSTP